MIHTFSFSYPWWYSFFCLILGIGYALFMYFRENKFAEYTPWLTRFMAILRAFSVSIISFLLLSPFIKTTKEDIKAPIVILASDRSESIGESESDEKKAQFATHFNQLSEKLGEKFEVKQVQFGSHVYETLNDSFTDKSTNISGLFQYLNDNYGDQNLGAVVIASDGIYNEGSNPLYSDTKLAVPIYTVALGDTTQRKDLYFQNIYHNKIAYLSDHFSVQVDISAYNCAGSNSKLILEMISGSNTKKISEENISIGSKNFFTSKTILVDANQSGVIRYRLRMSSVQGEMNVANNVKEFFVEVLDARQKILLLANAPHPDLGALKSTIAENKNYEVEIAYVKDFSGNYGKYNLVILHNLPSETADIQSIMSQLDKNAIPRIFVVGMQTSIPSFNKAQDVVQIIGNGKNNEDIQADFNPNFTPFTTSDNLKAKLKSFPPLIAPFGEYQASSTSEIYLYQNIKKIKTKYPLISFGTKNNIKTTVICGEGIWKWRFFDYLQNKNYDLVNELVNKTIQLTSIKTDKRKFRVNTSKNLYNENEQVVFDAQLYNDNYEMVNEPDVKLVIKDESNKEFTYTFSKTQNYYSLNADLFPQGHFTYVASTNYNGKLQTVSGKFNVQSIQLEQYDMTARHGLLKGISEKYHGKMVYPSDVMSLAEMILSNQALKSKMYQSASTKSIIHFKWLFFLILLLLGTEWFMRRYFGSY